MAKTFDRSVFVSNYIELITQNRIAFFVRQSSKVLGYSEDRIASVLRAVTLGSSLESGYKEIQGEISFRTFRRLVDEIQEKLEDPKYNATLRTTL